MELSAIQLVALFVNWDILRLHGEGLHFEVWVLNGVDCVDSRAPVERQQLFQ